MASRKTLWIALEVRMVDTTTKKQVSSVVIDQGFYGMRFSKLATLCS